MPFKIHGTALSKQEECFISFSKFCPVSKINVLNNFGIYTFLWHNSDFSRFYLQNMQTGIVFYISCSGVKQVYNQWAERLRFRSNLFHLRYKYFVIYTPCSIRVEFIRQRKMCNAAFTTQLCCN
jgi:hypothetical protein